MLQIKGNNPNAENGGQHQEEIIIGRNRSPSKMTKYIECWGADKPFANITESTMAKNIGLAVSVPTVYFFFFFCPPFNVLLQVVRITKIYIHV